MSRCIGGVAFGITYPVILIHASEVSIDMMRGKNVMLIQFNFMKTFDIKSKNFFIF